MRRLEARFSDSRNRVSRRSRLGKTENCAGRRTCIADSSTSTEAVMLAASRISSRNDGSGTSITKTNPIAATGTAHSTTGVRANGVLDVSATANPHPAL